MLHKLSVLLFTADAIKNLSTFSIVTLIKRSDQLPALSCYHNERQERIRSKYHEINIYRSNEKAYQPSLFEDNQRWYKVKSFNSISWSQEPNKCREDDPSPPLGVRTLILLHQATINVRYLALNVLPITWTSHQMISAIYFSRYCLEKILQDSCSLFNFLHVVFPLELIVIGFGRRICPLLDC